VIWFCIKAKLVVKLTLVSLVLRWWWRWWWCHSDRHVFQMIYISAVIELIFLKALTLLRLNIDFEKKRIYCADSRHKFQEMRHKVRFIFLKYFGQHLALFESLSRISHSFPHKYTSWLIANWAKNKKAIESTTK
jgi:hypothetical protein